GVLPEERCERPSVTLAVGQAGNMPREVTQSAQTWLNCAKGESSTVGAVPPVGAVLHGCGVNSDSLTGPPFRPGRASLLPRTLACTRCAGEQHPHQGRNHGIARADRWTG